VSSVADPHAPLDALIARSLADCAEDLRRSPWFGRENELVNLFVFGHLLRLASVNPSVLQPGQIGIEVAVPQLPDWGTRPKKDVRKDLVIWPAPRTTCWAGPRIHGAPPLAVMEWKTINSVGVPENVLAKRREHASDIDWLTRMTRRWPGVLGYAVFVDLRESSFTMECQLIREGRTVRTWG